MKFKKGDVVEIKPWKMMEFQYGLDEFRHINTPNGPFTSEMRDYKTVTITEVKSFYYHIKENDYAYTDKMILGYDFEYGEKILVRDFEDGTWQERYFLNYRLSLNQDLPLVCACDNEELDSLPCHWRFAKPIPPVEEKMIDIDGTKWSVSTVREALRKHAEGLKE